MWDCSMKLWMSLKPSAVFGVQIPKETRGTSPTARGRSGGRTPRSCRLLWKPMMLCSWTSSNAASRMSHSDSFEIISSSFYFIQQAAFSRLNCFASSSQLGSDQATESWRGSAARVDPGGELQQSAAENQAGGEEDLGQLDQHRQTDSQPAW